MIEEKTKGQLSKRRSIRLKNHDYSQYCAYFVTLCTHGRASLFGAIVGADLSVRPNRPDMIVRRWFEALQDRFPNTKVDRYVIMPDHVHFILSVFNQRNDEGMYEGASLSRIIQWFKCKTTLEYITGVKQGLYPPFDGHVWQRNYYEHVIRNEEDYREICVYINENPERWAREREKTEL